MSEFITIKLPVFDGAPAPDELGAGSTERTCLLCGKGIAFLLPFDDDGKKPDRVVLSRRYGTVHADCYLNQAMEMETREAWLTIAEEIASRPSAFSAAEIRAALTAVVRIVRTEASA